MAAKQQRKVNHNKKYPTSLDVLHDGALVGHVAGEHAALIFNLIHEQNIDVFGEIISAKAWSKWVHGFAFGLDLIIFSDDDKLASKFEDLDYGVNNYN